MFQFVIIVTLLSAFQLAEEEVTQCLNAVKENDTEKFDLIIAEGFDINSCTKVMSLEKSSFKCD